MAPNLHMLRFEFDLARLAQLGRRNRLPIDRTDAGYLVHCLIKELFGAGAPRLFSVMGERGRHLQVLAYSEYSLEKLKELATACADPVPFEACVWDLAACKQLPLDWPRKKRLAFEIRVAPVVRKSGDGVHWKDNAEIDVFLDRCWRLGKETVLDRETVYKEWLVPRLTRGGVQVEHLEMVEFRRDRLLRRTQGPERRPATVETPSVRFKGVLEIVDGESFSALMSHGIGRHRAFGFGMLLIRPE